MLCLLSKDGLSWFSNTIENMKKITQIVVFSRIKLIIRQYIVLKIKLLTISEMKKKKVKPKQRLERFKVFSLTNEDFLIKSR